MKKRWKRPRYSAPRHNRRALTTLASMMYALAATLACKCSSDITAAADALRMGAATAGRTTYIGAEVDHMFRVLEDIRAHFFEGEADLGSFVAELKTAVRGTLALLEIRAEYPLGTVPDKRSQRFRNRVSAVRGILYTVNRDLAAARRRYDALPPDRAEERKMLAGRIATRRRAARTLERILFGLDEVAQTADVSPSLVRRLASLIDVKALGDFFYRPVRARRAADRLLAELGYVYGNISELDESTRVSGRVLDGIAGSPDVRDFAETVRADSRAETADAARANDSRARAAVAFGKPEGGYKTNDIKGGMRS